jgi:hypothetical protein
MKQTCTVTTRHHESSRIASNTGLQVLVTLPPLPAEARRLFPDRLSGDVDSERRRAALVAICGILAAQSLLIALVLKLKVSSVFKDDGIEGRDRSRAHGGQRTTAAVVGAGPRGAYATASARGSLPAALASNPLLAGVLQPAVAQLQMDAGGSAAMSRLASQGLAWMPSMANCIVLVTFALAIVLNFEIGGVCTPLPPQIAGLPPA